ncbi:MAG: hypothetical protein J6J42_04335 [Lachnospiraceae bacterium]|nr:hypothetical protein [Lachnospiraceae bacterium]
MKEWKEIMNIAIVSCFVSNDMRVKSVYEFFVKRGYLVIVYESDFIHMKKSYRDAPPENYRYVPTRFYKKNLSVARLVSHAEFSRDVVKQLEQYQPELIYALVPPNSLVRDLVDYKKKHKALLLFDVIDLWPESLPVNVPSSVFPLRNWKNLRNKYINGADYVITQCDLYQTIFPVVPEKCRTVYFCREMQNRTPCGSKKAGELDLAYLGSINHLIDIDRIGAVVRELARQYRVTVHVIGNGRTKEQFINTLKGQGAVVEFYGEVYEPEKLTGILSQCDFGINIYKPETRIGMTMKSMDYFCNNLPVLNAIPHDTERLVNRYNAGINLKDFSLEAVEHYRNTQSRIEELVETELSPKAFERKMEAILAELGL